MLNVGKNVTQEEGNTTASVFATFTRQLFSLSTKCTYCGRQAVIQNNSKNSNNIDVSSVSEVLKGCQPRRVRLYFMQSPRRLQIVVLVTFHFKLVAFFLTLILLQFFQSLTTALLVIFPGLVYFQNRFLKPNL